VLSYLLDLDQIDQMVDADPMPLSKVRKSLILEQALIGLYEPAGNRAS
jgi:hypothetical protein